MKIFSKYQRISLLTIYFLLSVTSFIQTQNRINPFEIKQRLKEVSRQDSSRSITPQNITKSTIDTMLIGADSTLLTSDIEILKQQKKNPFEVDHVPLRKSNASKKAEELQVISESTKGSNGFLLFFLFLACALLAIVLNSSRRSIGLISKSLVNENMLKLFHREETIKPSSSIYILYLVYCINMSVFIYLISIRYNIPTGIISYSLILGIVVVVYICRHLGLSLVGKVFPVSKNADLYSFTIMVFNHFIGLFLIPINFLLAFGPEIFMSVLLWFAMVFLGIITLLRIIRGLFIVSEYFGDRLFQIIIYLCAFEIAPMIILLKTVINIVN